MFVNNGIVEKIRCRLDSNQRIRVLQTRPLPLGYGTKVHYDDIILRLTFQEKDKRGKIKLQCVVALFLLIVHFFYLRD